MGCGAFREPGAVIAAFEHRDNAPPAAPVGDVHQLGGDPGEILRPEDFAWVTAKLMDVADRRCGGRIVSMLEGGYDRAGLAEGAAAHVATLMGRPVG